MKMYTQYMEIYFADDGTEFFDKNSCLEYERKKRKDIIEKLNIEIWNENFIKLPLNEETNFDDICYFRCKTDEDFDKFNGIAPFEIHNPRPFKKTDLFFYYEDRSSFINLNFYEEDVDIHYLAAKKFLAEEK